MEQVDWISKYASDVVCVSTAPSAAESSRMLELPGRGYPVAQFDESGAVRQVVLDLFDAAEDLGRTVSGDAIMQWLLGPTTYLSGSRPFDLLISDPERVTWAACSAWGVQW